MKKVFSFDERVYLAYRLMILENRYPNEEKCSILREVVENGFEHFYDDVLCFLESKEEVCNSVKKIGVDDHKTQFVIDILNMYRDFHSSQNRFGVEQIPSELIYFSGFDREIEREYYHICQFMLDKSVKIDTAREYEMIKNNCNPNYDSYREIVPYYKEILVRYRSNPFFKLSVSGIYLTPDLIKGILGRPVE